MLLLIGYFVGGTLGGTIMACAVAGGAFANTVASGYRVNERKAAEAVLANKTPIEVVIIPVLGIVVVVVAGIVGAIAGADGVIGYFNNRPSLMSDSRVLYD